MPKKSTEHVLIAIDFAKSEFHNMFLCIDLIQLRSSEIYEWLQWLTLGTEQAPPKVLTKSLTA